VSQKALGWNVIGTYDDGGFSGGNVERPGLRRLLADIPARRVRIVVVYKVDRLTRSLADFAKQVELFDAQEVSFASVMQAFNTTSSMRRSTLSVLRSFAQFEREVTGERIRDKIAASKRKGMWMGGVAPIGYLPRDRTLAVDEADPRDRRSAGRAGAGDLPLLPLPRPRLCAAPQVRSRSLGVELPGLITTLGGSIVAGCFRPRSPLEHEFATHRRLRPGSDCPHAPS
jgi:Resolvase, N terminal domain